MAAGWAVAGNTPFMWTKQVASNFGGTRNPMVIASLHFMVGSFCHQDLQPPCHAAVAGAGPGDGAERDQERHHHPARERADVVEPLTNVQADDVHRHRDGEAGSG